MRRRSGVEPVIGHLRKSPEWAATISPAATAFNNAILAAVGYNFRRLIRWLRMLLRIYRAVLLAPPNYRPARKADSSRTTN
jgi:IS5 family transposase